MMMDVRTAFVTREGAPYIPQNYDRQWRGPVLLRQALASSYNLIAVKVLDYVGIEAMTDLARSLGVTTFDDLDRFGLALTLGGGEVRLLELTAAYGAFANGGYRVEPVTITRVENSQGQTLGVWQAAPGSRVMDERAAYLVTDILSDNLARASTFGEGSPLRLSRPAAAKTGTTTDWRDNWTIGYTPDLVVGVWAGNADNEPMRHVSGVVGAAPIWHDVMEALHRGRPVREFAEPAGMVHMAVCADSGLPPVKFGSLVQKGSSDQSSNNPRIQPCPRTIGELFIDGTQPTQTDDWHWLFSLDTRNGLLAGIGCPPQFTTHKFYTLFPAEAEAWVRQQNIARPPGTYSPLCPGDQMTYSTQREKQPAGSAYYLILTSPDQGSRYRLSPEIPRGMQQISVVARSTDGVSLRQVTLLVDGRPLATVPAPPYQTLWPMTAGTHTFTATGIDTDGNELRGNSIVIEVVE
jgi:membrane carboxypeptidase/penicillin-binding protein PbpC